MSFLKDKFGQDYLGTRRLFTAIDKGTKQSKIGERYPDFVAIKHGHCSLIEVKANKSKFFAGQVECFMLAQNYGLSANVLRVIVENNKVKDIQLLDYKSQLPKLRIIFR